MGYNDHFWAAVITLKEGSFSISSSDEVAALVLIYINLTMFYGWSYGWTPIIAFVQQVQSYQIVRKELLSSAGDLIIRCSSDSEKY